MAADEFIPKDEARQLIEKHLARWATLLGRLN